MNTIKLFKSLYPKLGSHLKLLCNCGGHNALNKLTLIFKCPCNVVWFWNLPPTIYSTPTAYRILNGGGRFKQEKPLQGGGGGVHESIKQCSSKKDGQTFFIQKLSKAFLIQKYTSRCYETDHSTLSMGYDAKNRGGYVQVVIKILNIFNMSVP